jgi:hypothetical protein
MTAYEKYQAGLELEKQGKTGEEIAQAIGYKNQETWRTTKAYFKGKALTKRAAAQCRPEENVPVPDYLQGPAAKAEKSAAEMVKPAALSIQRTVSARGKQLSYTWANGKFVIRADGHHTLRMTLKQLEDMLVEISSMIPEILREAKA